MIKSEISVKNEFFLSCIFVEGMISGFIGEKFGIDDIIDSNILGNSKDAINFDQKIDFLIESGAFSIIDNSKLSVYKAVRKEFLLNNDAYSIEESFTSLDHNDDFLLIMYPQESFLPRNEKLTIACYNLIEDVSQLVSDFTKKTQVRIKKENRLRSKLGIQFNTVGFSRLAMFISLLLFK
jgi:hypothetical protein